MRRFGNKHSLLRQVWYASFRGDEDDIPLWDRPEIRAVMAEPDLTRRFEAQAVVLTAVFRLHPLLLMMQGAVASQPAAAAMLAEFDQRRLDAAAKVRAGGSHPPANRPSVRTNAATYFGRLWTAPTGTGWWPNAAGGGPSSAALHDEITEPWAFDGVS